MNITTVIGTACRIRALTPGLILLEIVTICPTRPSVAAQTPGSRLQSRDR